MENVRATLATNLRRARAERDLSQEAFADLAGIDRTYVSGIERGVRNPSIELVAKIAHALGMTTVELLTLSARKRGS